MKKTTNGNEMLIEDTVTGITTPSETSEVHYEPDEEAIVRAYLEGSDEEDDTMEEEVPYEPSKGSASVQFPTGKPGHYSKDRRYVSIPKKSDKSHTVRSSQGKGAKVKHAGENQY